MAMAITTERKTAYTHYTRDSVYLRGQLPAGGNEQKWREERLGWIGFRVGRRLRRLMC